MKKFFVTILLTIALSSSLVGKKNIFLVSIPKCGAHMTIQILQTMGFAPHLVAPIVFDPDLQRLELELQKGTDIFTHMIPTPRILDILRRHSEYSVVFLFRDPRAYLASLAHHLKKRSELHPRARFYTIPDLIEDLMYEGRCQINVYGHFYPSVRGVVNVFNTYLGWLKAPNVLAVRYEELVGEPGGGDVTLQQETIKKIAQHLEVDFTQAQVEEAANSLLCDRFHEFRRGTIDSWKNDFSQDLLGKFYDLDSPRLLSLCWD